MSTIQDFENAPVGATATTPKGLIALKTGRSAFEWSLFDSRGVACDVHNSDEMEHFTLVPTAPTTVQGALDLAWELAHPLKEGQIIPEGTRVVDRSYRSDFSAYETMADITINAQESLTVRTLEPLPDPEPDWLNAPAVLASCRYSDETRKGVFTPSGVHTDRWVMAGTVGAMHWSELRDVTPLYPEGEKE